MDIIESILDDTEPKSEGARARLRRLVEARPDNPERALLEHLLATRNLPSASREPSAKVPVQVEPASLHLESHDAKRSVSVPISHEMRESIQSVLTDKLLLTAFQPVHALPGGEVVGVEALTRFVGEDGAGADVWFNEAAAAGLGTELEIAALHCALTAAHDVPEDLSVALNLTPATAQDPRVRDLLAAATLAADRIIIELTGSLASMESPSADEILRPLRKLGLRVAISASGAGFAPADLIDQLHPDIIKLDRHLIEGIASSEGQKIRAKAIVEQARAAGADIIAEGIETAEELEEVTALKVTAAQGYLLGRPSVHPLDWSAWSIRAQTETLPTS
ncbi:EAL domain-containing protein [Arthrobacter sp. fls2-241-R2A-200]|uniref:EAL domain-containing protein n=1 Tax=Arthrobacter sp. fls2-241-R2A-200 TaxID=3040281 RepID=UPI00254F7934|nr:EAL domain-containing protein [Arthrobacter sp. fls2-241-R2A-200]